MDLTGTLTRAGCVHMKHDLEARVLTIFIFLCLPYDFPLSTSLLFFTHQILVDYCSI